MSSTSIKYTTSALDRAREVYADIVANGDAIDSERELPDSLAQRLKDQGFFRLLVPRSLGGEEMEFPEYLDVVRLISHADGSTGWCVNQGAVFATHAGRAQRSLASEVWGESDGVVGNGPPNGATYETLEDGYRLSGRWNFSSGCRHANWLAAIATEKDHSKALLHFIPKHELQLLDVWDVGGLRGTGSFSFVADKHVVPKHRAMRLDTPPAENGPLYLIPQALLFACGFGCVALGVARSAIDCVINLALAKKEQFARNTLAEDSVVQGKIGLAEGLWGGAKAFLYESVQRVWESVVRNGEISLDERIQLRLAGTHAIRQSAQVVDLVYSVCGATAIFQSTPIQRKFQDIHVITQQVQGRENHYQTVGLHVMGQELKGGIF